MQLFSFRSRFSQRQINTYDHSIRRPLHAFSNSRRSFLSTTAGSAGAVALTACGSSAADPAEFSYGVASGDPLTDRIILWTHAKVKDQNYDVSLQWQIAKDASFTSMVNTGSVNALASAGFTAKVDATGLTAGNTYYYRFIDSTGATSPVGITRTLPASTATSVKFAVFSLHLCIPRFLQQL